ncbi:hypothetical protein [Methylotenera sp. L2L1]|uniref:hypothetical protein n=1 Tax=Methylotenera sp. L2L1 TaxID=1502770 RepID=UPI00068EE542|nr:hypothetical protein [Methylotenera sp. L2L1]
MANEKNYGILIDGDWSLEDLMNFSRLYFQNYSFIYCLDTEAVDIAPSRIKSVLETYELRDGLSYVNMYDIFRSHIAINEKPQVKSIQYNSPGWIELALNPDVALQVAKSMGIYIATMASTGGGLYVSYQKLHKIYIDLKNRRIKEKNNILKLEKDQIALVNKLNDELAKGLGFNSLAELDKHTKDIEESSKLIMAHYRRIEKMAKYVNAKKASFPLNLFSK